MEDDAERGVVGEGGIRCKDSMHHPIWTQQETFTNRVIDHG